MDTDSPDLHALIVDDDANYRALAAALLRRSGFACSTAEDGHQAIDRIRQRESFDLMLIDCEMPRINGLELIELVRQEPGSHSVYAVMLTGRDDLDVKIAAFAAGFDDFIPKAAAEVELVARIAAAKRLILRHQHNRESLAQMRDLAFTDQLTGLLNRRFFFEEAERIVTSSPVAGLVIFDLDRFKSINDTHGHLMGDRVLRDVAAVLRHHTRYEDFVIRFGGDEFVMMTEGLPVDQLEEIAGRITEEISTLQWTVGDQRVDVGVSAGVATTALLPERSVPALLDAADRDLYKNKWMGRAPADPPERYDYAARSDAEVAKFSPHLRTRDPRRQSG